MNATDLIERNTRAHTVDGYTSYPALASAHENTIRALCAELAIAKARGLQVMPGCQHATMVLGAANVLVEYEARDGEPRTHDHPGSAGSVDVLRVFINGAWCKVDDVIPEPVIEEWESLLLDGASEADPNADDRADAQRALAEMFPLPAFPALARTA